MIHGKSEFQNTEILTCLLFGESYNSRTLIFSYAEREKKQHINEKQRIAK